MTQHQPLLLLVAALAIGCVTINVYFPEAAIKDLSERIEDAVEQQAAQTEEGVASGPAVGSPAGSVSAATRLWARTAPVLLRVTASAAQAQESDRVAAPEVTNPAIRAIIASRARRLAELNSLKAKKIVGENKGGLVEARDLAALDLRERAAAQRLIKAENEDREALYREIAAVEGVDRSQLPRIRETYAATLREKAKPGDLIQLPDGRWTEKKAP